MSIPFPEPTAAAGSRAQVFERYLGFFRSRLAAKLRELRNRWYQHRFHLKAEPF